MTTVYEIYADEAWTHGGEPLNRYWCFFGGLFGLESDLDKLNCDLRKIKSKHGVRAEIKWTKVAKNNVPCCEEMIDCLFRYIGSTSIKYRQMFLDRSLVRIPPFGETPLSDLDVQFKLFYQFLKHSFGLKYMTLASGVTTKLLIRLDNHSSLKHKEGLAVFVEALPSYWGREALAIGVSFINSAVHERLQICDLLMGAAGFYGNKYHARRQPGKRGMTEKQKMKLNLAKYVYNHLRQLDAAERGTAAFNWFESTGLQGAPDNHHNHKARIWKFKPVNYNIDKGWENDSLDKFGQYVRPNIVARPIKVSDEETY
jgi:hypothetical protein